MPESCPHLHILLLADDYGEELWPLARTQLPACLAPLADDAAHSLLSASVERLRPFSEEPLHIATSDGLAQSVRSELIARCGLSERDIDVICVPFSHGSAFSIALACACIRRDDPDAVVFVAPANESVELDDRWGNLVWRGYQAALRGHITLLCARQPEQAAGTGFVRMGRQLADVEGVYDVRSFSSQARAATARRAVQEGALWYTDMFMARASVLLGAFNGMAHIEGERENVELGRIAETATFFSFLEPGTWRLSEAQSFIEALPKLSIEQAVLQTSGHLAAVPLTMHVSMLSTLADLDAALPAGKGGNRVHGQALCVASDNVTLYEQQDGRFVCAYGLDDVLVVDTADTVLVADKRTARTLAPLHEALGAQAPARLGAPAKRSFAWGTACLFARGEGTASWQLDVRPGALVELRELLDEYGLPAGTEPQPSDADAAQADAAGPRVHCVMTAGAIMVGGGVGGVELATCGDAFEVALHADASLLCDEAAGACIVLTAVRA